MARMDWPTSSCPPVNARSIPALDLISSFNWCMPRRMKLRWFRSARLPISRLRWKKIHPLFLLVKEVILMGGSISGGNVNAAAEANIYNDPEAAQIVFQAGWPLDDGGS